MCLCCPGSKEVEKEMNERMSQSRRCYNFAGLVILLGLISAMAYIGFIAVNHGNYQRLVKGYDSFGNTCDRNNDRIKNVDLSGQRMKNDRIIFFLNPYIPAESLRLCVNTCPDYLLETPNNVYKFTIETDSRLCLYNVPTDKYHEHSKQSWFNRSGKGPCPSLPIDKSEVLLNHCVPSSTPRVLISYLNSNMDVVTLILRDIYNSWFKLMIISLGAMGLSYILMLCLVFCCSTIKVITFIIACPLVISVGTGFLWWMFHDLMTFVAEQTSRSRTTLDVYHYNKITCLVLAVLASVGLVVMLVYMFSNRKRFSLVTPLLHETTKLIKTKAFVFAVGVPVLFTVPLMTWITYWVFVLIFLHSVGDAMVDKGLVTYRQTNSVNIMWWVHLVLLIPVANFIIACQKYVTADIVANIYKGQVEKSACRPLLSLFCNLGSVTLGSFRLSLYTFPKMVLRCISKRLQRSHCADLHQCLVCETCCLYTHVVSVNDNAYTVMAVKGKGFNTSSRHAYTTLTNNTGRVIAIKSQADFVLLLVKMTAVATVGTVALICFMYYHENLYLYSVLALIVCVATYYASNSFIASYQMAVHAMLWCYCHDDETNDGSAEKPYDNHDAHKALLNLIADGSVKINRQHNECGSSEEREAVV